MPYEDNCVSMHSSPNMPPTLVGRLDSSSPRQTTNNSKLSGSTRCAPGHVKKSNRFTPTCRGTSGGGKASPVLSQSTSGMMGYAGSPTGGWDIDKWIQSSNNANSEGSAPHIQYQMPCRKSHASAQRSDHAGYISHEVDIKYNRENNNPESDSDMEEEEMEGYYSDVSTVSSTTMEAMSSNCNHFDANIQRLPTEEELSKRRQTYYIKTLRFKRDNAK